MERDKLGRFIKGGNLGHKPFGGFKTRFKKGHKMLGKNIGEIMKNKKRNLSGFKRYYKSHQVWNKGKKLGESPHRGKHWTNRHLRKNTKRCEFCEKEFKIKYIEQEEYFNKKRFCSQKCFGMFIYKKLRQYSKPTSIEKKVYKKLKELGILFEQQKLIGNKFYVDAYIPSLNLIIEADGDYWHSLPKVKNKDKYENIFLKRRGYNLIRLSEEEINNNINVLPKHINKFRKGEIL